MRILIQRCSKSAVVIDGTERRTSGAGMVILLGIGHDDSESDIDWLVQKTVQLRIFPDDTGIMNRSILESGGDILLISQFTLHASTRKGNRPSYIAAARPEQAIPLYTTFIQKLTQSLGKSVTTGTFGADMQVELVNNGPVTIWMDSKAKE
ncbi:MAG: D-aminoacyl-tRNA deacylase [Sphingobacteriales bacterium]|jgi:D-tyrosyl-tRNA(Tyr) deacylase|nr:D-aminoacyl-tRNA deacylase [Sphingobacteriales bacterium]